MKKIAIILPYFGSFPNYFNFWLESVRNNRTIDWLLFTDSLSASHLSLPDNLKVINISFDDFRMLFERFFPFKISLKTPYKLCDFKIFYASVLKEYIEGYDFCGFCDCDLIFGDIRKFLTDDYLQQYNHFFGLGPLQLHKVDDVFLWDSIISTKAQGKHDYRFALSQDDVFVMDELPFGFPSTYYKEHKELYFNEFSPEGRLYDAVNKDYFHFWDSYNSVVEMGASYKKTMYYKYANVVEFWRRDLSTINRDKKKFQIYRYSNGCLERLFLQGGKICAEELLFVHFPKRKFKIDTDDCQSFLIVPNRFIPLVSRPTKLFLWRHGHKRIFDYRKVSYQRIVKKLYSVFNR